MTVKYVSEFSFPKSPARPSVVHGYARGGHVKGPSTPQCYSKGGSTTPFKYKNGGSADAARGVDGKSPTYVKLNDKSDPKADKAVKSKEVAPAFAKGGHWIAGATKNKGALHRKLGVPAGEKIPAKKLNAAAKKGGVEGKEANLAKTLKSFHKKDGGSIKVATGKVADGKKTPWNADDEVSPGSPKRTPPGQGEKNSAAAKNQFAHEGRGTEPATKQSGDVERMSGYSDFAKGGHARIKNLGHYAHGGKVKMTKADGEKSSGKAGSSTVKAPVAKSPKPSTDKTPSKAGDRVEMKSGTAKAAMGGLSRGTSPKRNAAIHAKNHKPSAGALSALAGALGAGPHQPSAPGMGPPPPGMQPQMGSPPGGAMGPRPMPPMAGGPMGAPGGMSHGGAVKHVIVHHVSHGKR
jgi:hypothetical protein